MTADIKQKVLISIDTEAPTGSHGIEKLIFCKTQKGEYGINYLMDCFDKYGFKALFFVDIAEAWEYGKEAIAEVLRQIDLRGHDVGVHIHPDRMLDSNRRFMWQYTYDEQLEMIQKCTRFFEDILGKRPISFRAGRYGANEDTLKILSSFGYKIDMSFFYAKKTCKLDNTLSYNQVFATDGLIELPVTSFKSFRFVRYKRNDKLDFSIPYSEFKHLMKNIIRSNCVDVCSFFLHSFSLVKWRKNPDNPVVSKKAIKKLDKELAYISSSRFEIISEKDVLQLKTNPDLKELDLSKHFLAPFFFAVRAISTLKDKLTRNI